jgi:hypothetical protein
MKILPAALLLALLAGSAAAQTGSVVFQAKAAGPWVGPLAEPPPCNDGVPFLFLATDLGVGEDEEGLYICADGAMVAVGGSGATALGDLTDVTTADAGAGDALVSDGAGSWSPGTPSIEGAAGTAATGQPLTIGEVIYAEIDTDCQITGEPGGTANLNCSDGQGYASITDEGAFPGLEPRSQINCVGSAVTCSDDPGMSRTTLAVSDHTVDTGPSPDCSGTSTYQDGEGGCDTVGGDLSGGLDALSLAANSVGLDELAPCAGPDEIVEYGASGVPSCIATPSGGGGIGGSTGAVDNALLLADGAGGALLKSAGADLVFSDTANRLMCTGDVSNPPRIQLNRSSAGAGLKKWEIYNEGGSSAALLVFGLLNDAETAWTRQNMLRLRVDGTGDYLDLGSNSTGPTRLRRGCQNTAPTTCAIGDDYSDCSGALCFCSVTNTWEQVNAVGSCV